VVKYGKCSLNKGFNFFEETNIIAIEAAFDRKNRDLTTLGNLEFWSQSQS